MVTPPVFRAIAASLLLHAAGSPSARGELHFHGQFGWEACACKRHLARDLSAPPETDPEADHVGNGRKYPRERVLDVTHVRLELDPDFATRSLAGTATVSFTALDRPLRHVRLDAVDLRVTAVEGSAPVAAWTSGKSHLDITLADSLAPGASAWIRVSYTAEPRDGWFFRTEAMGYPAGDDHFWTQGEPEKHRHWFPGHDFPNERFTSEVICRVPAGMTVLSNGRLVEEVAEGPRTRFHWKQETEHVNYLISVVGGHFRKLEKRHGELPLAFLTTPSEFAVAEHSFRDTPAILAFLEEETGVPFPWAKYYSVCVADFVAGGMENTSVTTLTTHTLFSPESGTLRTSHRLDAHEAAHQWFGNLVTCKDWSQLWLNEGFATYYTHLYDLKKSGTDEFLHGLYRDAEGILENADEKPMVWRGYQDPFEQFDYRSYPKGSWVLHMLRSQLGPDVFRACIRAYLERHRNGNVVTEDLARILEERTGRPWDEFFDQWVHHGGEPALKVAYAWDAEKRQAKLNLRQTQKLGPQVLLFDFPLPVRFTDAAGAVHDFTVRVHDAAEDFHFPLPSAPKMVRIDPGLTVLAKVEFTPPDPMLFLQLESGDLPGRLDAAKALASRTDRKAVDALGTRLREDPFHGVRAEAARSLAKIRTPEALAVLLASAAQPDDRVRMEVVRAVAARSTGEARDFLLREVVERDPNPEIVAVAVTALGKFPADAIGPALTAALGRPSYRQRIAAAAIRGLRDQADPAHVGPVLAFLRDHGSTLPTSETAQAWDALASLARDAAAPERDAVHRFLAEQLEHPREGFRKGAIEALGTLGESRSLALLEPISRTGHPSRQEPKAAAEAIRRIRERRPQAEEVRTLREETEALRRDLRALQESLEALRKQTAPEKKPPGT